jgi:RNA polymerase sigma-70 factor (ECF subfamily)
LSGNTRSGRFPTTSWTRVGLVGDPDDPAARLALEGLCRDYWFPLYAFGRRKGLPPDEAEDLVQGVFAALLERGDLAALDRSKGRLRSYLMAAASHLLANHHEAEAALKRGGGRRLVPIDRREAEARRPLEPSHRLTPERLFDREWAMELLGRVLARLEAEGAAAGRSALFERLRPALQGDAQAPPYRALAAELNTTEGAVRVAAHRLRARYRELLREEIARTTDDEDPAAVDDEIGALLAALAGA